MINYKNCLITDKKGRPKYFGHEFNTNGYDDEGYRTSWFRIDFPDDTYVLCPTVDESIKYIDNYMAGVIA